jgi:hypothetical protein
MAMDNFVWNKIGQPQGEGACPAKAFQVETL